MVTAGQKHDAPLATELIDGLAAKHWLADKGYDSDTIRDSASHKGLSAQIPPRKNRKDERVYDKHLYKERHNIECFFGFLKHYRRLLARFDKLKRNFTAFLHCVAALQWLK